MKVYAKIRQNGEYHSQNISQAVYGFREMGAVIFMKVSQRKILYLIILPRWK